MVEGRCRIEEETGWRGEVVENGDGGEEQCGGVGRVGRSRMEGRIRKDVRGGRRGKIGWRRGMEGRISKDGKNGWRVELG